MASAFSHAFAALAAGKVITGRRMLVRFWLLGMFCAIVPDADVLAFKLGIAYAHPLGHRGFTHSIVFAILLAVVITGLFFRQQRLFSKGWWLLTGYFFLSTFSHALLDAITSGGLGVGFFIPFENSRYFFPWRPVQVSPIGVKNFFSEWGLRVIKSELLWIWLPAAAMAAAAMLIRKLRSAAVSTQKPASTPNF